MRRLTSDNKWIRSKFLEHNKVHSIIPWHQRHLTGHQIAVYPHVLGH